MNNTKYALIIPFYNKGVDRERNLKAILNYYLKYNEFYDILVIEDKSNTNLNDFKNIKHIKITSNKKYFTRGHCINYAIKHNVYVGYIVVDSDVIIDSNILINIKDIIGDNFNSYIIPYKLDNFFNLSQQETIEFVKYQKNYDGEQRKIVLPGSGAFIISRDSYYKIGGFNKKLCGFGGDDNELSCKAKKLLNIIYLNYNIYHLNHKKNFENYKHNKKLYKYVCKLNKDDLIKYLKNKNNNYLL